MRSKFSKKYRSCKEIDFFVCGGEKKKFQQKNFWNSSKKLKFLEIGISVRNGWIPARYSHPRWVAETDAGLCRDSPKTTTRWSHQSCSRIFQQLKSRVSLMISHDPRVSNKNKFRPSVMLNLESQMNRKIKTVKSNSQLLLIHKMMTKR